MNKYAQAGDGVGFLDHPVRFKVKNPDRWITLCQTRDLLEQQGGTSEAFRALAAEFRALGSNACAAKCERMAKNAG